MKVMFLTETHEGFDCLDGLVMCYPQPLVSRIKGKYAEGGRRT